MLRLRVSLMKSIMAIALCIASNAYLCSAGSSPVETKIKALQLLVEGRSGTLSALPSFGKQEVKWMIPILEICAESMSDVDVANKVQIVIDHEVKDSFELNDFAWMDDTRFKFLCRQVEASTKLGLRPYVTASYASLQKEIASWDSKTKREHLLFVTREHAQQHGYEIDSTLLLK